MTDVTESLRNSEAECAEGRTAPRVSLSDIEANIAYEVSFTAINAITALELDEQTNGGKVLLTGTTLQDPPVSLDVLTICLMVTRNGFTIIGKSAPASADNFDAELGRKLAKEDAIRQLWPLMGYALRDRLSRDTDGDADREVAAAPNDDGPRLGRIESTSASNAALNRPIDDFDDPRPDHTYLRMRAVELAAGVAAHRPEAAVLSLAETFYGFITGEDAVPPASVEAAIMEEIASKHPAHIQRVIVEYRELNERWQKLRIFIDENLLFNELDNAEREALLTQADLMFSYAAVLLDRLNRAGVGKDELLA